MRKIFILFIILSLLSACKSQTDSSKSTEFNVFASDLNNSYQSDISNRPLSKKIPVFTEGSEEEWLNADLKAGGNGKYTIYVINDPEQDIVFEFAMGANEDMITPKDPAENSLYNKMYMRIINSDGSSELPKSSRNEEGYTIEYNRISKGNNVLDVEFYYWNTPLPNPVTLMRSMLDTLVINE